MTDWLTIPQAAARTGKSEEEIRRAIVMGELRAEPTGDLSSYLVDAADLGVPAAPTQRACCGSRLLRLMLALGVIGAGLIIVVGLTGTHCVRRCGGARFIEFPVDPKACSDAELHRQIQRLTAQAEECRTRRDIARLPGIQQQITQLRAELPRRFD